MLLLKNLVYHFLLRISFCLLGTFLLSKITLRLSSPSVWTSVLQRIAQQEGSPVCRVVRLSVLPCAHGEARRYSLHFAVHIFLDWPLLLGRTQRAANTSFNFRTKNYNIRFIFIDFKYRFYEWILFITDRAKKTHGLICSAVFRLRCWAMNGGGKWNGFRGAAGVVGGRARWHDIWRVNMASVSQPKNVHAAAGQNPLPNASDSPRCDFRSESRFFGCNSVKSSNPITSNTRQLNDWAFWMTNIHAAISLCHGLA